MAAAAVPDQQQQQQQPQQQQMPQQPPPQPPHLQQQQQGTSRLKQVLRDVFAGTMGGISVTMVGHPFDTIKVRLQTQPMDKPIYCESVALLESARVARVAVLWWWLGL